MAGFQAQKIELADREWIVPRLPWRIARDVQASIFAVFEAAGGAGLSETTLSRLKPADLDRLADAIYFATTGATSGPKIERKDFDELPFGVAELLAAFGAAAACCGMEPRKAGDPPAPKAKPSTGTR